jgi:hypothetical protein
MSANWTLPLRSATLLAAALPLLAGCGRTSREAVFSSGPLKVVAVTESTLDINVSKYRHYTSYLLYFDGEKIDDAGFAKLLRDSDSNKDRFVHEEAIVLDKDSVLIASHNGDGTRCWTTRLVADGATVSVEPVNKGRVDCTTRPAPRGWRALYDESSNLLLVREHPFHVYPIAGYWYPLWMEGDVVALYQEQKESERFLVKLARMPSGETLAEQSLPMSKFADPQLLNASADEREQWLQSNFLLSTRPQVSISLRPDHHLKTITPEVWAQYQEIDRRNREEDAAARAAGEAWHRKQMEELRRDEAARQGATE